MKGLRSIIIFTLFSASISIAIFNSCNTPKESFFLNLNDTVNYVGMDKCRACHEDKYNTFIQTGMGQSFGLATKEKSAGIFENNKAVYDPKRDLYYFPYWENNSMKLMEYRLQGGDTVHKRIETIQYIIGSGHHTNSHFWSQNGYVFQAPITFYTQQKKWDLPPGFETFNNGFDRKIDIECMSCHNAIPSVVEGSVNKFSNVPMGIDCERCHGPGELHVAEKVRGIKIDTKKEVDRSIVNPSRLPWKLQVDVCQRCHLQGNNVLKPGKKFTDFRPGMSLSDVFDVYMPKHENPEYFVMAGHAERFQMSACFVKSNPASTEAYDPKLNFTCITCHDPHVSVRQTNTQKFNNTCTNCHSEKGKSKLKHCTVDPKKLAANLNNCVKCHMPSSGTADIPHVSVHDHYIRRPKTGANTLEPGRLLGLYAVNNPNPDKRDELQAYISWYEKFSPEKLYLEKAAALLASNSDPATEIHFAYSSQDYARILKIGASLESGETDAWTAYRLGKAYDQLKQLETAMSWYRAAWEKMPLNIDFGAEYANALIRLKRLPEAEAALTSLLNEQSKNELVLINLGALAFLQEEYSEARQHLQAALDLNPDNSMALMYLAELYLKTGKNLLAKAMISRALKLKPGDPQLKTLSDQLGVQK